LGIVLSELARERRSLMRKSIIVVATALLLAVALIAPASAAEVVGDAQAYAFTYFPGEGSGQDSAEVGVGRDNNTTDVYVLFCDVKVPGMPTTPEEDSECWWSSGDPTRDDPRRTIFTQNHIVWEGTVEILPTSCSWDPIPDFDHCVIEYLDVVVEFDDSEVIRTHRQWEPAPGIRVVEHRRDLAFAEVTLTIGSSPVSLGNRVWTNESESGLMQSWVIIYK
jgi:hypothetical protein